MKSDAAIDTIVTKLEEHLTAGNLVWVQPWSTNGLTVPSNAVTGKAYNGLNHLSLNMFAVLAGHETNLWLTYKQAEEAGGNVRKGSKSYPALRPIEIKKDFEDAAKGEEEAQRILLFKGYALFNLDQCEGLDHLRPAPPLAPSRNNDGRRADVDTVILNTFAIIRHGGDQCYYNPARDDIHMVEPERFVTYDHYYGTCLHELAHWTGAQGRLDRLGKTPPKLAEYAYEELVAEITSMMCCQILGIDGLDRHNAAYIQHWLKGLKDDRSMLPKAAADAYRACRFIIPQLPTPTV